jgi:hypothetical protein
MAQGFTRTEKKKPGAPTIVEFSLTPSIREQLQRELEPYLDGEAAFDEDRLADIMTRNLPKDVLDELKILSQHDGAPSAVYVIRNLPAVKRSKIPRFDDPDDLEQWLLTQSYALYTVLGVGNALGLHVPENGWGKAVRDLSLGLNEVGGNRLHKHNELVSTLSPAWTNGAVTRFTDMHRVLEEAKTAENNIPVQGNASGRAEIRMTSLRNFSNVFPDWSKQEDYRIFSDLKHNEQFENLVAKHSSEVIAGAGDVVLWSNNGSLFHQAIPKDVPVKPRHVSRFTRATLGIGFDAPDRVR